MSSEPIKDISFKESFRRARNSGLDTFTHNGKKYTTELASSKAAPKAEAPAPKAAESKAESPKTDASVPSPGRYKQDTYETPLKSAARKYGSDVTDNLGKIAAGLGVGYGVLKGGSKLLNAASKGRQEAKLVAGNTDNATRMARATAQAEKDIASNAAKRDTFKASEERLKSGAGSAAEKRLTGVDNNPRRGNIPVRDVEKNTTAAPAPTRASRTKGNEDEVGIEFRKGGSIGSASRRADGIATKGKTKGRMY
jgi:hypothetical protein